MNDEQLYTEIASLPSDLKKGVKDFIDFLKSKSSKAIRLSERKYGYAKGFFEMSADFDAPLDEFKDYM